MSSVQGERVGIDRSEFERVWKRLNPEATSGEHTVYMRVTGDRLVYIGQTNDLDRRNAEHLLGTHNRELKLLHDSGTVTEGIALLTCSGSEVDVLEQRAVAIGRSLGPLFNVVRGGQFSSDEKKRIEVYLSARFGHMAFKNLAHGILTPGRHTLRLLGFHVNADRAVMYLEDSNGFIYFNICPRNVERYRKRNEERARQWVSWKPWIGQVVDVDVHLVDGVLLQTDVLGPSDAPLTNGREVILRACDETYSRMKSRVTLGIGNPVRAPAV